MLSRTANLLGAHALAVGDVVRAAAEGASALSAAGPAALVAIDMHPGQSLDTLARVLRLTSSGAVRLVDRLASEGLVERRPGADGRTRALHLSAAGERAVRGVLDERQAALVGVLEVLSEREQEQLAPLLEKLLQGLAGDRARARGICRLCDLGACREGARCPLDLDVLDIPWGAISEP